MSDSNRAPGGMQLQGKRTGILLAALLMALTGWGGYWFVANHERHYREIRLGVSSEARHNPFLAAERFLKRLGVQAQGIPGGEYLRRPPPATGVLLVNRLGPQLSPDQERALVDWMERGGHLIVTASREWQPGQEVRGTHLLGRYGVRLRIVRPAADNRAAGKHGDDQEDDGDVYPLLPVDYAGVAEPIGVAFQPTRVLEETTELADWAVEGEEGAHLLQFSTGQGRLTVLSDHRFLTNEHIGEGDHALFLALLTQGERRVWLLYGSDMPSLVALLWRVAPFLVLSALGLGGFWIWSLTLRTGPLLSREIRVRRNLMEHLDAAADYAWRTDRAERMLLATRNAIEQAWRRRHPGLEGLGRKAQCARIAELSGLAPSTVEKALYGRAGNEHTFIRVSAAQQKLAAGVRRRK